MTGNDKKMLVLATLVSGGTNISDATATAGDVLVGKIAYGVGGRLVGTLPNYFQSVGIGLVVPEMPDVTEVAV